MTDSGNSLVVAWCKIDLVIWSSLVSRQVVCPVPCACRLTSLMVTAAAATAVSVSVSGRAAHHLPSPLSTRRH